MSSLHRYLFPAMWIGWAMYWWAASRNVKVTARHEPMPSRLLHIVPLTFALILLWRQHPSMGFLNERFMPWTEWAFAVGALVAAGGFLFTIWARIQLGRNWSGTVTIKEGHELVTSGPYALVRHPIYTGLLLAFLGSALALGEWRGVLGLALATAAFWFKLRLEEAWMRQQFGDAYAQYARHVAALVPFLL